MSTTDQKTSDLRSGSDDEPSPRSGGVSLHRPPRKPHAKALTRALELLERVAVAVNACEVSGNKIEGADSVALLQELAQIQAFVHSDGTEPPLHVHYRLAEFHAALGQHMEALKVLDFLLEKRRSQLGERHVEIAKLLRLKAVSFEKLDRPTEGSEARRQAIAILAELLGKPDVVDVLGKLVADEVQVRTAGGAPAPEAWEGVTPEQTEGKQATPKRGDIWWVHFPQYPNDPHQPRPAVVVSVDHRNERADKVQVVPLSSNNNGHRMNYAIPKQGSGLQYDSCAKCGDITAVAKTMLRGAGPIGQVNKVIVDGIVELAQQALMPQ